MVPAQSEEARLERVLPMNDLVSQGRMVHNEDPTMYAGGPSAEISNVNRQFDWILLVLSRLDTRANNGLE
jgi:hypothetical protein